MKKLLLFIAILASSAAAQQRQPQDPHLGYVFPAGGQIGTTVTVAAGGQFLQGTTAAIISGDGIRVTVGEYERPLTQKEVKDLTDKLKEARSTMKGGRGNLALVAKQAGVTDQELRGLERFRQARTDPKRQLNPQIAETVTLQIAIDPGTAPGLRELRLLTPRGLTNPIRFVVGRLEQTTELEPNDQEPQLITRPLPTVVDGQIMPGDVDRFAFTGRKGERIVASAATRTLVPYLADAVPGWFQASLTLYDQSGKELTFADHRSFDPEPVLGCVLPADGKYVIEIRDALYRGREDFVYRLTLAHAPTPLTDLPQTEWVSLPELAEIEPNDSPKTAQAVPLERIVVGRIGKPGDVDVYRVAGHAGQKIVAEITARRIGSPLDSLLVLTDSTGRVVASNDDTPDLAAGLMPQQADSYLMATLPAAGAYYVTVRDAQGNGGEGYVYRLRISAPHPTFALRVVPSSVNARAAMSTPLTVHVLRHDGFSGPIQLRLKDAPAGFALSGATIPSGVDTIQVTLTAPPQAGPTKLQIEGNSAEAIVPAVPAEDMMQAFAYRHLVPMQDLLVAVLGRANRTAAWSEQESAVRLSPGGTAQVLLGGPTGPLAGRIKLALAEEGGGISIQSVTAGARGLVVTLRADSKAKIGTKGNLLVVAFADQATQAAKGRPAGTRRVQLGYVPAIPFEIVGAK